MSEPPPERGPRTPLPGRAPPLAAPARRVSVPGRAPDGQSSCPGPAPRPPAAAATPSRRCGCGPGRARPSRPPQAFSDPRAAAAPQLRAALRLRVPARPSAPSEPGASVWPPAPPSGPVLPRPRRLPLGWATVGLVPGACPRACPEIPSFPCARKGPLANKPRLHFLLTVSQV